MATINRMQDGDNIPDSDHVMRYCSPKHVHDGEIVASAFSLRENEDHLSVNWLEYFSGSFHKRFQALRKNIGTGLRLSSNGKFAKIPVGNARETIGDVRIIYKPTSSDPSHTGIYLPSGDNREHALELANLVGGEVFPAT